MPVDNLQQMVARFLVGTWGFGSELWAAAGMAATLLLIALALAMFLPDPTLDRWKSSPWGSFLLSDGFFVGVVIAAFIVLRMPALSQLELNPDEAGLILGARTLLHDPRFWISFENTTLGPLSTFSLVTPALIGLPIDYTTSRVVGMFVWIAVFVCLFVGLRELYSPRLARILVLPVVTTIFAFSYPDYVAFNGEHMAVLMLALAFVIQVPLIRDVASVRPTRSFLFGFTLALVPLAKIQPGPIALAWGVIGLVHAILYCRRRAGFIVAGALAPVALLGAYLLGFGAAYDFWQSYVLNNLLYAAVGWNATQQDVSLLENVLRSPQYFLKVPDSRGFVAFTGLLIVVAGAIAVGSRSFRRRLFTFDVVQGLLLLLVGILCVLLPRNNWTHYLLLLVVPVAMLNAAIMVKLFDEGRERGLSFAINLSEPAVVWTLQGSLIIAASICFFGALAPTAYALKDGHPAMPEARQNLEGGRTPDPLTAAILRYAQPGDPVAHWGVFFTSLARAGVSLGTRDVHIERAFYPSPQQDYYLDRFVTDVLERQPRVLVDTNADPDFHLFRLKNFPKQWQALAPYYDLVEDVEGNHVYMLRSEAVAAE